MPHFLRRNLFLLIIGLTFNIIVSGYAQGNIQFDQLSTRNGLSSTIVNAIIQDKQGYIWFGTEDGLNRYDGYEFTVFHSAAGDSTKLRNDFISRLLCTNDGKIWSGTIDGGVSVYDPKNEIFTTYRHIPGDSSSLKKNNVAALYQDRKGAMWIGTWLGGFSKMDTAGGAVHFIHYLHDPKNPTSLSDNRVSSILEDREGNLWVGTWNGLNRMDRDGHFTRYFHSEVNAQSLGGNMVWSLTLDSTGGMWIGTWDGGVSRYDRTTDQFHVYKNNPSKPNSLGSNRIRCVYTDREGIVWVGTYDTGLERYDRLKDNFNHYRNVPSDHSSLPDDDVESLMQDNDGTFWIGTGSGVAYVNQYRHKFPMLNLSDKLSRESSHQPNSLWISPNGDLWCGTRGGGLFHVSNETKKFTQYRHSSINPQSLSHDNVRTIFEQSDGSLWVGTNGGGLNRLNKNTGEFQRYMKNSRDPNSISAPTVSSILHSADGFQWFGTDGEGLIRRNPTTGTTTRFRNRAEDSSSLSGDYVWAMLEDQRKNIWVGTWGAGLSRFEAQSKRFTGYRPVFGDSTALGSSTVLCFAEDHNGIIWIGTPDGLSSYDYATNRFVTYGEKNGISNSSINCIAVDKYNSIWVATNLGVSKFDTQTKTFRNYTVSDGLQGIEFRQGVSATDKFGRIYFGGSGGINVFDPDSVKDNPFIPPVYITRINVMEQRLPWSNVSDAGIMLNYDQNFISFEYTALSYSAPERNNYSYILEGVDADWSRAVTRRFASYPNLRPGTYTFRVRGSNNDGVWNLEGASLTITIIPPFWMTWWFRSITIILFLSFGPIIYFRRVKQLKKEKKRQEEFSRQLINSQEDERKRIASELHDSIGQNLLYIKNSAVLGKNKKDLKRFSDISETASSSIEEVRRITYDLFPYQLDRMGLTKAIESVVRKTGESSGIECRYEIKNIDGLFSTEKESSIFRIIQECLNNIVKHSGANCAAVFINKVADALIVEIGDNGKGFEAHQLQVDTKGFGLKNIQNRVSLLNGKISYTGTNEFKTLISITLPIKL